MSHDHRTALDPDGDVDTRATDRALSLMHAGVPLSLLLDLAMPVQSADLYGQERADTAWVPVRVA